MSMKELKRIEGKGVIIPDKRVSAVFEVDFEDHPRYVLRELLKDDIKSYGLDSRGFYLGFPSTNAYTEEPEHETAVRAAKQWGFDVEWKRHLRTEDREENTFSYHLCEDISDETYDRVIISYYDQQSTDNERHLMFMRLEDALNSEYVIDDVKRILEVHRNVTEISP